MDQRTGMQSPSQAAAAKTNPAHDAGRESSTHYRMGLVPGAYGEVVYIRIAGPFGPNHARQLRFAVRDMRELHDIRLVMIDLRGVAFFLDYQALIDGAMEGPLVDAEVGYLIQETTLEPSMQYARRLTSLGFTRLLFRAEDVALRWCGAAALPVLADLPAYPLKGMDRGDQPPGLPELVRVAIPGAAGPTPGSR